MEKETYWVCELSREEYDNLIKMMVEGHYEFVVGFMDAKGYLVDNEN